MKRLNLKKDVSNLPLLFDFSAPETTATESPAPVATPAPAAQPVKDPQPARPSVFDTLLAKVMDYAAQSNIAGLLRMVTYKAFICLSNTQRFYNIPQSGSVLPFHKTGWVAGGQRWYQGPIDALSVLASENHTNDGEYIKTLHLDLAALDEDGTVKILPVKVVYDAPYDGNLQVVEINVGKWTAQKKAYRQLLFPQDEASLGEIVEKCRPWVKPWLEEHGYHLKRYLAAPWMETLDKAGYRFVSNYLRYSPESLFDSSDMDRINRLTQPGTKPANIFKTEKCVYANLKDKTSLATWDLYRRMVKGEKLNQDTIRQAIDRNYNERDMETISSILGVRYGERTVFTWNSLMNYLNRIDMNEALEGSEPLGILNDYLHMCAQLDMQPRIDGDSLKREHDIAARLVRNRRDEELEREMKRNAEMAKAARPFLEYHEDVFFIRPIYEQEDLLDEAKQQHNCVASYGPRIVAGQSIVLQMRETRSPRVGLITVELSPDLKTIRQKLLAYNQPIRNKAQTEFLERWHKHVKAAAAAALDQSRQEMEAAA